MILPLASRSQVVHFNEAVLVWLQAARARLVWLTELLRASERAWPL